jgi:phytoene/squalene synthetase
MTVSELETKIQQFEDVSLEYVDYGARDSEPDGEFQLALVKAIQGKREIPQTAEDWQLLTVTRDCSKAATALTAACTEIVDAIMNSPISDANYLSAYLKEYCWRVAW